MNYVFKAQSFSNQVLISLRHLAEKSKFCWTVNRSVCTPWRSPQSPPFPKSLGIISGSTRRKVGIISGSIWESFQGWGSFRGQDHFGGCTDPLPPTCWLSALLFQLFMCFVSWSMNSLPIFFLTEEGIFAPSGYLIICVDDFWRVDCYHLLQLAPRQSIAAWHLGELVLIYRLVTL